jgi:hypothetical protein
MYQIKLTESATNSDIYFDVRRKQRFEPFEEYTEREKTAIFVDWDFIQQIKPDLQPRYFLTLWLAFCSGRCSAPDLNASLPEPLDTILGFQPIGIIGKGFWFNYSGDKSLKPADLVPAPKPASAPSNDLPF